MACLMWSNCSSQENLDLQLFLFSNKMYRTLLIEAEITRDAPMQCKHRIREDMQYNEKAARKASNLQVISGTLIL